MTPRGPCIDVHRWRNSLRVVTLNGRQVSRPLSEADARAFAEDLRRRWAKRNSTSSR